MSRWISVAAVGLLATACGSPASPAPVPTSPTLSAVAVSPTAAAASLPPGTPVATSSSRYGRILVDGSGRTLYLFDVEIDGVPRCYGACAVNWPPFLAARGSTSDPNLSPALVGIAARSDGSQQMTYNGHPLYYYAGDGSAGEIKCQAAAEFGGGWYVIDTKGNEIRSP